MSAAYSKELIKVAVAKACLSQGITHTSEAVMESLADVLRHFIETIAGQVQELCETSGRAVPGVQDLLPTLVPDWRGLSNFAFEDVKQPQSRRRYHEPFPFTVNSFPVTSNAFTHKPALPLGEQVRGNHVPSHLPMYPPIHTYKALQPRPRKRILEEENADDGKKRAADAKKIQMSLIRLEQHSKANSST